MTSSLRIAKTHKHVPLEHPMGLCVSCVFVIWWLLSAADVGGACMKCEKSGQPDG